MRIALSSWDGKWSILFLRQRYPVSLSGSAEVKLQREDCIAHCMNWVMFMGGLTGTGRFLPVAMAYPSKQKPMGQK